MENLFFLLLKNVLTSNAAMLVAPICPLELKSLGLCYIVLDFSWFSLTTFCLESSWFLFDLGGAKLRSDFVIPKFQVSPTSVSRTSKNGCKFNFTTARLVLSLVLTSCIDMYNPLFYFISVFFCCLCFSFICFLCWFFVFVHTL